MSDETINAFLVRDPNLTQSPLYFISKALVGLEMHYQNIENEAFASVNTSRKLRRYFLTHTIVIWTNLKLKQALHRLDLAGRLTKLSIEMFEFVVSFE